MVAHAFNPSAPETETDTSELEASLAYRVKSRLARASQRNPVLKYQKEKKR